MSSTTIHQAPQCNSRPTTPTEASPPTSPHDSRVIRHRSDKITDAHFERMAVVYVRQSTQQQVLEHRESTARQTG